MKIAVCISGQLRDYYNYIDNVFEKVINKYNADVFLHTWNHDDEKIKEALNSYKPVSHLIEEFSPGKVIYSEKWLNINNDIIEKEKITVEYDLKNGDLVGKPQNIFSMYYSIFKANELKREYENEHKFKYDIVLRFRPDIEFNVDLNFNNNIVIIPQTLCSYGICDHFAYGPSNLMDRYSDVWNNIERYLENDKFPKNGPGKGMRAETILKYHMNVQKIEYKQVKFDYNLRGVTIK